MDISIRFGQREDIKDLIHIWQICFGDDLSYIRFFMKHCFCAENTVVACVDGKVAGVTYMLPATLQGKIFMYGYAVGVLPEYRGNAICENMHQFIKVYSEKEGFVYGLHPANEKLFSFYRRIGLCDMYALRIYDAPKNAGAEEFPLKDVTTYDYELLRRDAFSPLVEWSHEMMEYIHLEAKTYGGFVKKIIIDGNSRILIGKKYKEEVTIKETTLTDEEIMRVTPFLYQHFNAEKISYILPNKSSLGTIKETILGFGEKDENIYMNLFMD